MNSRHFQTVLFDLDGTLTDSGPGITNAARYALHKFGIDEADPKKLEQFIGPPLWDSFEKFYGLTKDDAEKAVVSFREYYLEKGKFENAVYTGIPAVLKALQDSGKTLIVATSKPEVTAKEILEHFELTHYFSCIAGGDLEGMRAKKADVIRYALACCPVSDLSEVIMIGDREHDIFGAKAVGVASLGVLYGYGSRNELEQAGADFIAGTVQEIGQLLLNPMNQQ